MMLESEIRERLQLARMAARQLAQAPSERKNRALGALADLLRLSTEMILAANREDLTHAAESGHSGAFVERLTLTPERIEAMAQGVEQIARLQDPAGEI